MGTITLGVRIQNPTRIQNPDFQNHSARAWRATARALLFWILVVWVLDSGFWILDSGFWILRDKNLKNLRLFSVTNPGIIPGSERLIDDPLTNPDLFTASRPFADFQPVENLPQDF